MSATGGTSSSGPRPDASRTSRRSDDAPDRVSADVGIVCSHKGELKSFLKRLDRQKKYSDHRMVIRGGFLGETLRVAVVEADNDFASHRAATELLVNEHRPSWIFSCGFSSALNADVKAGDVCLANEVADTHGNLLPVKCSIGPRNRVHVGRLISADSRPVDASSRATLASQHPGLALDLGSLAIVQVCQERSIRCFVIRSIVEELSETLPPKAAAMLFNPDSRAVGSVLGSVTRRIGNWAELSAWRDRGTLAAANLDQFLTGLVEQIGEKLGR